MKTQRRLMITWMLIGCVSIVYVTVNLKPDGVLHVADGGHMQTVTCYGWPWVFVDRCNEFSRSGGQRDFSRLPVECRTGFWNRNILAYPFISRVYVGRILANIGWLVGVSVFLWHGMGRGSLQITLRRAFFLIAIIGLHLGVMRMGGW